MFEIENFVAECRAALTVKSGAALQEVVARAIYACPIPVVSAVGHEIDVTIADLVADKRALTPREAGEHGRRARARRLVLTHFSDEIDAEWARAEAADAYGGPVELAREGAVYEL